MSVEAFLALSVFAFVTSITPGPSNFMLLASGANFGFVRTLPQVLGITVGFYSVLLGVGVGLGAMLAAFPALNIALKIAGGTYLLYLAWRIGMSRSLGKDGEVGGRPLTLLQSAAFQWINPKAWVVATTAMAVYASPDAPFLSAILVSVAFAAINLPSVSAWAGFGMALRGFLSDPVRLKWFNVAMGMLLAATLWPMMTR
jgi:threonine/homoserine/homoserine lactone efflux protein